MSDVTVRGFWSVWESLSEVERERLRVEHDQQRETIVPFVRRSHPELWERALCASRNEVEGSLPDSRLGGEAGKEKP